jgi:regulatory protein YycI of two-component signal transduction system YycFG
MMEVLLEVHNNFPKNSQKGIIITSKKKIQKVFDVWKVPDHVAGIQINHVFPLSKKHQLRIPISANNVDQQTLNPKS